MEGLLGRETPIGDIEVGDIEDSGFGELMDVRGQMLGDGGRKVSGCKYCCCCCPPNSVGICGI